MPCSATLAISSASSSLELAKRQVNQRPEMFTACLTKVARNISKHRKRSYTVKYLDPIDWLVELARTG